MRSAGSEFQIVGGWSGVAERPTVLAPASFVNDVNYGRCSGDEVVHILNVSRPSAILYLILALTGSL